MGVPRRQTLHEIWKWHVSKSIYLYYLGYALRLVFAYFCWHNKTDCKVAWWINEDDDYYKFTVSHIEWQCGLTQIEGESCLLYFSFRVSFTMSVISHATDIYNCTSYLSYSTHCLQYYNSCHISLNTKSGIESMDSSLIHCHWPW